MFALLANVSVLLSVVLTEATGQEVTADLIMSILKSVTDVMSMTQIVAFISAIIAGCMGFVFLWWGVRKGFKAIMGAVTRGKLRIG